MKKNERNELLEELYEVYNFLLQGVGEASWFKDELPEKTPQKVVDMVKRDTNRAQNFGRRLQRLHIRLSKVLDYDDDCHNCAQLQHKLQLAEDECYDTEKHRRELNNLMREIHMMTL